jgi:hypothetical protein
MSYDPKNAMRPDRTGLLSAGELAQGNENAAQNGINITLVDANGNPYSSSNPIPTTITGAGSVKGGSAALATNDTSKAVAFGTAFSAAPVVTATIAIPTSSDVGVQWWVDQSTVTTVGFTVVFGGAIPSTGYKLNWIATLPSS